MDLSTIISIVNEIRIILDRERLVSILGIRDEGNTVTIDSNNKSIDEDPDCDYASTCSRLRIRAHPGNRRRILHESDFSQLLSKVLTYFFGHTFEQKGDWQSDIEIVNLYMIEKLQNQSLFSIVSSMIHTICNTDCDTTLTRVFHYPVILSRIFAAFNVDFTGED